MQIEAQNASRAVFDQTEIEQILIRLRDVERFLELLFEELNGSCRILSYFVDRIAKLVRVRQHVIDADIDQWNRLVQKLELFEPAQEVDERLQRRENIVEADI